MEYFILLCTMIVLICGLLFYVNAFPTEEFKQFIRVLAFIVIIGSTIVVFGMIFWDARTRKSHAKRKVKLAKQQNVPVSEPLNHVDPISGRVIFRAPFFALSSESEEDSAQTLNQILENLFSLKRVAKRLRVINRKRMQAQQKLMQMINKRKK